MAKHRRQNTTAARRIATASAVAVGAAMAPGVAQAAPISLPTDGINVDVPGIAGIPGIEGVPGAVDEFLPSAALGSSEAGAFTPSELSAPQNINVGNTQGQRIVNIAYSKIGSPYVYGASGPNTFDCSGFTSWVYNQVGKSIPRTSQAQAASGTPVSYDNLQPGDIVAFYGGASHVGIYVGNNTIVDALNSGTPVGERPLDYMPFHSAVRF